MTQKQIDKTQNRLADLYKRIQCKAIMPIVNEIVELETLLEHESNK